MPSFYYKLLLFAAVLLLTRWGLRVLQRRLGVAMQYYLLVGTTGLLALVLFNMPLAFLDRIPMLGFTLNSWHVVLWYASLWYSFGALFRNSSIPRLLSLPCFFCSLLFCLMLAGAGLLWVSTGGAGFSI